MISMNHQRYRWAALTVTLMPLCTQAASSDVYNKEQLLSVGASLGAVLLMVIVLGFIARRFSNRLGGNQMITVLSNLPVGTRERVVLIEVSGTRVLVGACAGSVSLLHVFDEHADSPNSSEPDSEMGIEGSR